MNKYKHILAIDPSGSFTEGKGTTGWVLMNSDEELLGVGYISAEEFCCKEEYWDAHIELIRQIKKDFRDLIVVIEEYVLYRDRAQGQTNSKMETCRVIGVMQHYCWRELQDYSMQLAASVKNRWSDALLLREGILYRDEHNVLRHRNGIQMSLVHIRDAFRHAIHYAVCRNKPKPKLNNQKKGAYDGIKSNYQS